MAGSLCIKAEAQVLTAAATPSMRLWRTISPKARDVNKTAVSKDLGILFAGRKFSAILANVCILV